MNSTGNNQPGLFPSSPRALTVSELTASLRALIETSFPFVTVCGEISGLARPASGHLYFSLKDEKAKIRAVMFRGQQRWLDRMPADGDEVLCRGRLSLYEPRGEYQIVVDSLEHAGAGVLRREFEALRKKLAAEGLFAAEAKKPLPLLPERITLITSPDGAAVHDFIRTARRRFANIAIEIMPVTVQGESSAAEIREAVEEVNRMGETSVIVICRGGGAAEDLAAFNDETVARAVFASAIPVVSAIGHETDFTICDLVADVRAATPTAAAELTVPEKAALAAEVERLRQRVCEQMRIRIETGSYRLAMLKRFLSDPIVATSAWSSMITARLWRLGEAARRILSERSGRLESLRTRIAAAGPDRTTARARQRCDELADRLERGVAARLAAEKNRLNLLAARLDSLSPLAVLGRGYAVALRMPDGETIEDAAAMRPGDRLRLLLKKGELECEVIRGDR